MKRTYINRLPKNEEVKNTNVRIENGELIVEVDFKEKFKPKFGDIVKVINNEKYNNKRDYIICIFPNKPLPIENCPFFDIANINRIGLLSSLCGYIEGNKIVPASESEKKELFDKLEKVGKRWNPEKKQLEDIRWKPKEGEKYYFVDLDCNISRTEFSNSFDIDRKRVEANNCFRTKESIKKVADQIRDIFKNSKAE